MSKFFHSETYVARSGFRWCDGRYSAHFDQDNAPSFGRFLVPIVPEDGGSVVNILERDPALFLKFASLPDDEASFLSFANEHGELGLDTEFEDDKGIKREGDPLWVWRHETRAMRAAWELAQAIENKDIESLRDMIGWVSVADLDIVDTASNSLLARLPIELSYLGQIFICRRTLSRLRPQQNQRAPWEEVDFLDHENSMDDVCSDLRHEKSTKEFARARPGEYLEAARFHLARLISSRIEGSADFYYAAEDGKFHWGISVLGLLSGLWAQFARAVEGSKQYRSCSVCRNMFEIERRHSSRANEARYCSAKCKSKAQWNRGVEISRLAAAGRSVEEIAAEVGASVDAVENHIERSKSGSKRRGTK